MKKKSSKSQYCKTTPAGVTSPAVLSAWIKEINLQINLFKYIGIYCSNIWYNCSLPDYGRRQKSSIHRLRSWILFENKKIWWLDSSGSFGNVWKCKDKIICWFECSWWCWNVWRSNGFTICCLDYSFWHATFCKLPDGLTDRM